MLETLRDVAIIILAMVALLQVLIILILAVMVYKKLSPVLDNVRVATNNVKGTTTFLSEAVVKPVIGMVGFAVGARRTLSVLTGFRKPRGRR